MLRQKKETSVLSGTEIRFHENSVLPDLIRHISYARNDDEIALTVAAINTQGRRLFGSTFQLRFDRTIQSKDFRKRIFLTR